MGLTEEQERVIAFDMDPGSVLMVQSYAGVGKTYTTVELCKRHMDKRILYLAFNRSLMESARAQFEDYPHVHVETFHSLALHEMKRWDDGETVDRLDLRENVSVYDVLDRFPDLAWEDASGTVRAWDCFLAGVEAEANDAHLVKVGRKADRTVVLEHVKSMWSDVSKGRFPCSHDAYLKLYHVSAPLLDYECIVVDECQDTTALQWDLVLRQRDRAAIVGIGDMHQQIYGFRHVCDPFQILRDRNLAFQNLRLTKTFRFGPKLAWVSSAFLTHFKDEVVRFDSMHEEDATEIRPPMSTTEPVGPCAFVFRSNRGLLRALFRIAERTEPLYVLGETFDPYEELAYLADLQAVASGKGTVQDKVLRRFRTMEEATKFFRTVGDFKSVNRIDLFEDLGERALRNHWMQVQSRLVPSADEAHWILGTVHQMKGLEFPVVALGDDFPTPSRLRKVARWKRTGTVESLNLVYVAITRAQKTVYLNEDIYLFCLTEGAKQNPKRKKQKNQNLGSHIEDAQ